MHCFSVKATADLDEYHLREEGRAEFSLPLRLSCTSETLSERLRPIRIRSFPRRHSHCWNQKTEKFGYFDLYLNLPAR